MTDPDERAILQGRIVGAAMMRQRLENDELEKQAAKKDKKIEKLEKKLEKEKMNRESLKI